MTSPAPRNALDQRPAGPVIISIRAALVVMIMIAVVACQPSSTAQPTQASKPSVHPAAEAQRPSTTRRKKPQRRHPKPTARAGSALAAAESLTVKGRAPRTGYSREQFGAAWEDTDGDGCDQRNDVLNRDLTHKVVDGCLVLSGTLHDPYTGRTIHFRRGETTSEAVQIDHVVSESDAWQTGAQQWSAAKRLRFATDTLNLYAVDGPTNESKGDGDTATWLPANKTFRCTYVAHQVAIKKKYGLWVTSAERAAMEQVLSRCPGMKLPRRAAIPDHPASHPTTASRPQRSPHRSPGAGSHTSHGDSGSSSALVHPGAFCAPVGATGVTDRGTPMVCTATSTDPRARWRSS